MSREKDEVIRLAPERNVITKSLISESIGRIIVGSGKKEGFSQIKIDLEDWLLKRDFSNINIYESNMPIRK